MPNHVPQVPGLILLLLCMPLPLFAVEQGAVEFDRWYVALLGTSPIGWMHHTVVRTGDRIETNAQTSLSLKRGGTVLAIEVTEVFVESAEGKPIEAKTTQKLAQAGVTQTYRFDADKVVQVTTQGGQESTRQFPISDQPWLAPAVAERYFRRQCDQGATDISYWTFEPSAGPTPIEVHHSKVGPCRVEVHGKTVPAVQWESSVSLSAPVTTMSYLDDEGHMVKSTMSIGAMQLVLVESDPQLAQAQIDPPELVAKTLVTPDRPIDAPRQIHTAVFDLHLTDEDGDQDALGRLPTAGFQRVLQTDGDSARVQIDLDRPVLAADVQPQDGHRKATMVVDSDHPSIGKLVREALGDQAGELDEHQKATVLCRFVHRHITNRDLSVGFASASEVARTAQGDCSEFTVLLMAMLRSAGIASRAISGLVYVDHFIGRQDVFGYHMWSQAWIESPDGAHWVDFDASLNSVQFDATHIALSNSALADGYVNDMVNLVPLLGRLSIKVIEAAPKPKDLQDAQ